MVFMTQDRVTDTHVRSQPSCTYKALLAQSISLPLLSTGRQMQRAAMTGFQGQEASKSVFSSSVALSLDRSRLPYKDAQSRIE